ncbi:hypothetical protein [Crenobacter cavernae]|uniref:hypothetical protein n=1 Tax=Crenobacter cavernae TaxID=2290923 RepID=UPI0011C06B9A|nr:hypothetical protein [Crenobacter cavernae]
MEAVLTAGADADAYPGNVKQFGEAAVRKRLRDELARVTPERDIHKKALSLFSPSTKSGFRSSTCWPRATGDADVPAAACFAQWRLRVAATSTVGSGAGPIVVCDGKFAWRLPK